MFSVTKSKIFVEDKCYGFIGGAIRAFSGSPSVSVMHKVKNKELQSQLEAALGDYKGLRTAGQEALGDYISKYFSNQASEDQFTGQEVGAASDFYNGNVANNLAQLRASRASAVGAAADVGARQAIRAVNSDALQSDGGPSSYQDREMMGAVIPIRTQAAVDDANQARQDYGFVKQGQIDLAGKRNAMLDTRTSSTLMPYQVRSGMNTTDMGMLGNLIQADQANHFYGLKQASNPIADFADAADAGIMNAASIYSSVAGGMGGMKFGGLVRYKDGGKVAGRKNMSESGGNVRGPGGPTADKVAAWLSDGEYVMPAAAVKMPGVLPLLERIRQMALRDSTAPKGGRDGKHFWSGGDIAANDAAYADQIDTSNAGGPPMKKSGGGGGGLTGEAQYLLQRASQDQMAQWFPSSTAFGSAPAKPFVPPTIDVESEQVPFFARQGQGVMV